MKDITELLAKLQNVHRLSNGGYWSLCPGHDDNKHSLGISQVDDKILVHCFKGCEPEAVVNAVGLKMADLFIDEYKPNPPVKPVEDKVYDYLDEKGNVLYQVVRYLPKDFKHRHKNGDGNYIWSIDGIRKVPYHLPDLLKVKEETVYIVEGEKDANSLWDWGCIATTNAGGANSWKPEFAKYFTGKKVVVIPHRDSAGRDYSKTVARSLEGKARELRVILIDAGKDISDWLELDGEIADLPSMEQDIEVLFASDIPVYRQNEQSIQWDKKTGDLLLSFKAEKISEERTGIHARVSIFGQHESLSWSYFNIERREDRSSLAGAAQAILKSKDYNKDDMRRDLDSFCAGLWEYHLSQFTPEEISGDDTPLPLSYLLKPYIIENGGTILYAPPGRGKSYTALLWAVSIDAGVQMFWPVQQRKILFINLERSKESLTRRLGMVNKILGLPPTRKLLTVNARGHSLVEVTPACRKSILKNNVGLIILDSISRAGMGDLNENQSGNRVIDSLSGLCPSWVALGHTSRATEDHMYGSIMQDAGADVCVQLSAQSTDEKKLGIGWMITKQNDIGYHPQKIYALEFNEFGLTNFRPAKNFEFSDIVGKITTDKLTAIREFVINKDSGDASASEVEAELGFDRAYVSKIFNQSGAFIETRKVKQSVYYGVKT
jgi:hypothetical protein